VIPRRRRAGKPPTTFDEVLTAVAAATQSTPKAIAPCRPVDVSLLPPPPPELGRWPGPCVDDTIRQCCRCGCDCWVAPKKLALADDGRAVVACFVCALVLAGPGPAVAVDLDPDRVERRRR
jgi:hypothetical protein